nr:uncharacterized protein [uncultured bacterium]
MIQEDGNHSLTWRGYATAWAVSAATIAPLWIWMDGRYGLLKSLFFALFFAHAYAIKRNMIDIAVFSLIMTGLQLFSRQVVDYHQLVVDANPLELATLAGHAALTLGAAWLMSWLFDLRGTPGPTYTRLAAYYMIFYMGQFILHALFVMVSTGLPISPYHLAQFLLVLLMPLLIWRPGALTMHALSQHVALFRSGASWKRRFRDFDNTRAVVFSCLALFAASVVWFGFVHYAIGKLGLTVHYTIPADCPSLPGLGDFMTHSLSASLGLDDRCTASASLLSRIADYLQVIISLFLFLVLVQALALAFSAPGPDQPPERPE